MSQKCKTSAKESKSRVTLPSSTESSDSENASCRILPEREMNKKGVRSDSGAPLRTKASKTKRRLTRGSKMIIFQDTERQEELCNDDATVCEPLKLRGGAKEQKAPTTATEAQADGFHTDDQSQRGQKEGEAGTNNEIRLKKNQSEQDDESDGEGRGHSQDGPESLHVAASVNVEAEKTVILTGGDRAELSALQIGDEPKLNERNWPEKSSHDDNILRQEERGILDSTRGKRKRKKKSAAENISQEMHVGSESDLRLEDSAFSDQVEKKKKKRLKSVDYEDDGGVKQLQSKTASSEPLNDDAELKRKKKKKKEKRISVTEKCEENTETSQGTVESVYQEKRQKHKNKQRPSSPEGPQVSEQGADVSLSNCVAMLEECTELTLKRKKKKKRRESVSEVVDISHTPGKSNNINTHNSHDTTDAEEVSEKKKKKKKTSRNISGDVAQTECPPSVRKKERASSFLDADTEEKDTRTHQQQREINVEEPAVSTADVENSSAGIIERGGKRRKMSAALENLEKDHEADFEEASETCRSALADNTDTWVKRKKKHKRTESESLTPKERLDSAAEAEQTDEALGLKKKKKKKRKDELRRVIQESQSVYEDKVLAGSPGKKDEKNKKKERNNQTDFTSNSPVLPVAPLSQFEMSSSGSVAKKKQKKKKLHNPGEDFMTDL